MTGVIHDQLTGWIMTAMETLTSLLAMGKTVVKTISFIKIMETAPSLKSIHSPSTWITPPPWVHRLAILITMVSPICLSLLGITKRTFCIKTMTTVHLHNFHLLQLWRISHIQRPEPGVTIIKMVFLIFLLPTAPETHETCYIPTLATGHLPNNRKRDF